MRGIWNLTHGKRACGDLHYRSSLSLKGLKSTNSSWDSFRPKSISSNKVPSKNSIYILSIPITKKHSYIHCNHKRGFVDAGGRNTLSVMSKIEEKITQVVGKGWKKISSSDNRLNKSITKLVTGLLETIPYEENCLRSFPSKKHMVRYINEEYMTDDKSQGPNSIIQSQLEKLSVPAEQLDPIPLYHPTFQQPSVIVDQLRSFREHAYKIHLKRAIGCALGIPLTLPLILLPVVPNVPGIYLTYRLYCNVKALVGIKHLDYLISPSNELDQQTNRQESEKGIDIHSLKHINIQQLTMFDDVYRIPASQLSLHAEDDLILSEEAVDRFCKALDLPELKNDLTKAIKQEHYRIYGSAYNPRQ
ncbi:Piso0_001279 [Millerozyma farinosa CBS 7064]|uniref:Piso0_001279 protein n=1 Tax=Pichia sorbitophila (strain ATCC MYA-4447 / BCRC 22081 / CBS 7064 / NBRC 10061 / NRRL Y-12695) TaxID=559304 RepID=G8YMR0_PICSO|nr:Piso0_001279 [Millerozyma farinosa CBS 7064]